MGRMAQATLSVTQGENGVLSGLGKEEARGWGTGIGGERWVAKMLFRPGSKMVAW